ncbi:hypothetical protein LQ764DRAFT_53743 [Zygosaccharomyces rouxii]|nr:hypothetical protein LQ764DRAFT_53743 [Zygosaccharomyces rouxii]
MLLQRLSPFCKFYIMALSALTSILRVMSVFRWVTQVRQLVICKILYFLPGDMIGQKLNFVSTSCEISVFVALSTVILKWHCINSGPNPTNFLIPVNLISNALHMPDGIMLNMRPPKSL